jgi:fatty acid desaturase
MVTVNNYTSCNYSNYLQKQKLLGNINAIVYTFIGYCGGISLLILPNIFLNLLGVFLLSHSFVYSAYLCHEFMHGTIFKGRRWNTILGTIMLWLNGGCYYGFKALMVQHIAHHVNRVDILNFDIPVAIQQQPPLIRKIIIILEWLYFPLVSFWSRWRWITAPWWSSNRHNERARLTIILIIRGTIFTLLGLISLKALLLYFVSYISMIHLLRWMDAFQHTYEAFPPGTNLPKRDRTDEQKNTYSNLLSRRYPWLNLLFLNFGYHNTHHALMKCPWYSLPELDRELASVNNHKYIPLFTQLTNYHRFRITRLITGQGETVDEQKNQCYERFYGAVDVSFLTLY